MLYIEQLQIFQLTDLYFRSLIFKPGGLANYLGLFVTQFYIWNHVGGIIISLLLLLLYLLLHKTARFRNIEGKSILLLIPVIAFVFYFMSINAQLGGLVSVLLSLSFVWLVLDVLNNRYQNIFVLLFIPLVYCFAGGGGLFIYTILLAYNYLINEKRDIYIPILLFFISGGLPFLIQYYVVSLSWIDTWIGTSFYKGNILPNSYWILINMPVLTVFAAEGSQRFLSNINKRFYYSFFVLFCLIGGTVFFVNRKKNHTEEAIFQLDYLLKRGQWSEMLAIADEKLHNNSLLVSYVNLALLNEGSLANKMMQYNQRPDINEFTSANYLPLFVNGETFYNLDMFNASRAYLFMANTQTPNGNSPFMYQRLAELELIRGNELSSMKYVSVLKNTLFYADWANAFEKSILTRNYSEEILFKINKYAESDDFLAKEMLYNLISECDKNPDNDRARDFLFAKFVLSHDYVGFMDCLNKSSESFSQNIPRLYQEFILMYAYMTNNSSLIDKWDIQNSVIADFHDYLEINQSGQSNNQILKSLTTKYHNTYWFYLQF